MTTTKRRLMVLVGPGENDYWSILCTETPKLFVHEDAPYFYRRQWRKADYIGIPVESQAAADDLYARISQERKKDGAILQAYRDKLLQWEMDNPKPQPRPPQEVLAALGITYPPAS